MNSLPNTPYGSVTRQHGPRRRASVTTATPRERKVSFALSPTRLLKRVRSKSSGLGSPVPGLDGSQASDVSEDEESSGVPTPLLPDMSSFAGPSPFPDLASLSLTLSPGAKAFRPAAIEPAKVPGQTQAGGEVFLLLQQMHARAIAGELMMRSDFDGNGVYFRLPPVAPLHLSSRPSSFPGFASASAPAQPSLCSYPLTSFPCGAGSLPRPSGAASSFTPTFLPGLGFERVGASAYQSSAALGNYALNRQCSNATSTEQPGTRLPSYASEIPTGHSLGAPLNLAPITPLPRFATQLQSNTAHRNGQGQGRYQPPHQRTLGPIGVSSGQSKVRSQGGGPNKYDRGAGVKARPNTLKWSGPMTDVMCALAEGQVLARRGNVKLFDPVKGFGFISDGEISALAGRDIFVHYTAIRIKVGFRALWVGEEIEYNLVQVASGGYQALNVRGADGKPLRGLDSFDPSQIPDDDCSMDSPEASPQRKTSSSSARHSSNGHPSTHPYGRNDITSALHRSQAAKPDYPRRDTCQKTW